VKLLTKNFKSFFRVNDELIRHHSIKSSLIDRDIWQLKLYNLRKKMLYNNNNLTKWR